MIKSIISSKKFVSNKKNKKLQIVYSQLVSYESERKINYIICTMSADDR